MKTSITTITIFILILSGLSLAQNTTAPAPAIPDEPVQSGEAFQARVRSTSATNSPTEANVSSLPATPVRRRGESDAAFQARQRAWEAQVRQIISAPNPSEPVSVPAIPDRPVQRRGESDAAYQARVLQWQAQVDVLKEVQIQQDLQKLIKILPTTPYQTIYTGHPWPDNEYSQSTGSNENIIVIPILEIKAEDLLSINEDLNIMSRIFRNELINKGFASSMPGGLFGATTLRLPANAISSMYLQDYGALFLIQVDFPLSAPPEIQEQPQEPNKGEVDQVWQQTKEQIYEPQVASAYSYRRTAENLDVKYDAQKVENLKKTLITVLKHASNISVLKPDESVIIRITGIGQTINAALPIDGGAAIASDRSDSRAGRIASRTIPQSTAKRLQMPESLLIRAKKSYIDAFAKGDLDFEKFREKVQVFSYPILGSNSDN